MIFQRSTSKYRWCVFVLSLLSSIVLLVSCDRDGESDRDWSRHDAHRRCSTAIAAYPDEPAPPCQALHVCANEARLTAQQRQKLLEMIRETSGCGEP